jgi:hypothetical protein
MAWGYRSGTPGYISWLAGTTTLRHSRLYPTVRDLEFGPRITFHVRARINFTLYNGAQTKHIGMKPIGMKPIATKPIGLKPIGY